MPRKPTAKQTSTVVQDTRPAPVQEPASPFPKGYAGPTSGVMAPGAIGKAAREAARKAWNGGA